MSSDPCKRAHPRSEQRAGQHGWSCLRPQPLPGARNADLSFCVRLVLLISGLFHQQTFALLSVVVQWCSEAPLLPSLGEFWVSSTKFASAVAWSSPPATEAVSSAPGEEGGVKGGVKPRVGAVALCRHHPSGKHCSGAG